jgi:hypothetical protein
LTYADGPNTQPPVGGPATRASYGAETTTRTQFRPCPVDPTMCDEASFRWKLVSKSFRLFDGDKVRIDEYAGLAWSFVTIERGLSNKYPSMIISKLKGSYTLGLLAY